MTRLSHRAERVVIGWNEFVDLPDWGISGLLAKIDTGARTSALHVDQIEPAGRRRVRFDVVLSRRVPRRVRVEATLTRTGTVRSSSGHSTRRYFTTVAVRIGTLTRRVELSLVDRGEMRYRMLLGRTALRGLLVDPSHSRLLGASRQRRRTRKAVSR